MTEKKTPDWERIELEYRAGVLSIREIAANHGITDGAIRKKAKAQGWERDISAKVQAKADALVRTEEVRAKVRTASKLEERVLIEASAQAIADVRMSHRGDIRKAKTLAMTLLEELSSQTIDQELFQQLGELLRSEDERGQDKLNDLYQKAISTPSRVISMQKLADTLKTLISLEREAYNIENIDKLDITSSDGSMTPKPTIIELVAHESTD